MEAARPHKIAFCFMIYDCFENEEVWTDFFSKADPNKYTIYVHAKKDYTGAFSKHIISEHVETVYAEWSLVKCSNALFRAAYEADEDNYKFILLSGHCIPVKTFSHVYNTLTVDDRAYIDLCPDVQRFPRNNKLLKYTERKNVAKHSQWVILTRPDVAFVKGDPYIEWFKGVEVPDESYYMTVLQHEGVAGHVKSGDATTFTNWEGKVDYPFYTPHKGLKTYTTISEEELSYLTSYCQFPLFARKFARGSVSVGYLDE